MKTLALIAVLSLTTINAFAAFGNDGPSAMPKPKKPQLLAEAMQACGFMCRNGAVKGVRIYDNGAVEKFSRTFQNPEQKQQIAQLEAGVVENLKAEVEQIPNVELVDFDQGKPECMDAATTTYLVEQFVGTKIKIAQNVNCHDHVLPNSEGQALVDLLKSFMNLGR